MKPSRISLFIISAFIFVFSSWVYADVPDSISYQGKLTTPVGLLLDGNYAMTFKIYDVAVGGVALWTEAHPAVTVDKGVFSVMLGSITSLPATIFDGSVRYLGVQVGADPEMTPRKEIVSVAYAFHAFTADSALNVPEAGLVSVDGVSNAGGNVDLIQQNAITIMPDDPSNTITISETHSIRTDNPHQTTAAQTSALVSADGVSNPGGNVDFIAGSNMTITPDDGANTITFSASDNDWTVDASDGDTTLFTGGPWGIARYGNILYGNADSTHVNLGVACTTGTSGQNYRYCTVGGGLFNTASYWAATVGGGYDNTAGNNYATVGGGYVNTASGSYATVGGGYVNTASGSYATVGGGVVNAASGYISTVGGGGSNSASGLYATVGGGYDNTASNNYATVGGGYEDSATGYAATVAGGYHNIGSGDYVAVGGGNLNRASNSYATIGGGLQNTASAVYATVPGGFADTVAGNYSFATGDRVRLTATADYTFAFGSNFSTSTANAVVFYHSGAETKVGIMTTSPANILTIKSGSTTDPIADSWTTYPCDSKHKNIIREINPHGYLEGLKNTRLVEWTRKATFEQADLPKFTKKSVGPLIDDPTAPKEIMTFDEDGNPNGIDLLSYCGYLHTVLKETAMVIEGQQKQIDGLKGEIEKMKSGGR